jgi:hypothetical protein
MRRRSSRRCSISSISSRWALRCTRRIRRCFGAFGVRFMGYRFLSGVTARRCDFYGLTFKRVFYYNGLFLRYDKMVETLRTGRCFHHLLTINGIIRSYEKASPHMLMFNGRFCWCFWISSRSGTWLALGHSLYVTSTKLLAVLLAQRLLRKRRLL